MSKQDQEWITEADLEVKLGFSKGTLKKRRQRGGRHSWPHTVGAGGRTILYNLEEVRRRLVSGMSMNAVQGANKRELLEGLYPEGTEVAKSNWVTLPLPDGVVAVGFLRHADTGVIGLVCQRADGLPWEETGDHNIVLMEAEGGYWLPVIDS